MGPGEWVGRVWRLRGLSIQPELAVERPDWDPRLPLYQEVAPVGPEVKVRMSEKMD